jgi:hypothetical protein
MKKGGGHSTMYKDKRALAETLRKYQRHILGPLFVEAADTIEELLDTVEQQKAEIAALSGQQDEPCEACKIGGNADGAG